MVRDPLSDFLVRVRNAQDAGKPETLVPYSALLWEVAKILERQGYLAKVDRRGKRTRRMIEAGLVYDTDGKGRITGVRRVSKLSKRVYKRAEELFSVKHGFGTQIVSTSKGLMTVEEARRAHIGGEVLFEIW